MMETRKWREVRAEAIAAGRTSEEGIAGARAMLTEKNRAYRLAEIRKSMQISQASLAKQMGLTQGRISQIEKGELSDATSTATLRAYVEALGGHVEVIADFGDSRVRIA